MRSRLSILCALTAVLLLLAGGVSEASLLGVYKKMGGGGSRSIDTVWLRYVEFGAWRCELFNDIPLIENIGKTFWISSDQQDSNFGRAVALLTNGVNDSICVMCGTRFIAAGIPTDESKAFFGLTDGPDFAGRNVGAIGVRINGATAASPGQDPNRDGIWTDYTYDVTLLVATGAPVPEPASIAVLGSFVAGFCIRMRCVSSSRK